MRTTNLGRTVLAASLLCLVGGLFLFSPFLLNDEVPYSTFQTMIAKAEERAVDLTAASDLFHSSEFIEIYENPGVYKNHVITLLKAKDVSKIHKLIAVYSMQWLPLDEYLEFLDTLLDLTEKKVISKQIFEWCAFPQEVRTRQLEVRYKDPRVRIFLEKLRNSPTFSEDGEYFDRILTGEAARDTDDRGGT